MPRAIDSDDIPVKVRPPRPAHPRDRVSNVVNRDCSGDLHHRDRSELGRLGRQPLATSSMVELWSRTYSWICSLRRNDFGVTRIERSPR